MRHAANWGSVPYMVLRDVFETNGLGESDSDVGVTLSKTTHLGMVYTNYLW